MKAIGAVLSIFVVLPMWFYLLHSVLVGICASELQWFIFWAYVPVTAICVVIGKLAENAST